VAVTGAKKGDWVASIIGKTGQGESCQKGDEAGSPYPVFPGPFVKNMKESPQKPQLHVQIQTPAP